LEIGIGRASYIGYFKLRLDKFIQLANNDHNC
jgi:hypothetical protein